MDRQTIIRGPTASILLQPTKINLAIYKEEPILIPPEEEGWMYGSLWQPMKDGLLLFLFNNVDCSRDVNTKRLMCRASTPWSLELLQRIHKSELE